MSSWLRRHRFCIFYACLLFGANRYWRHYLLTQLPIYRIGFSQYCEHTDDPKLKVIETKATAIVISNYFYKKRVQ